MVITIAASTVFVVLVLALVKLTRQIGTRKGTPVTADWIDEISVNYRPMMRLLDPAELAFLQSQPGFTRDMATKFRKQRCQIFLGYLQDMDNDFASICMALKGILLNSEIDRPDLATALVQRQVIFAYREVTIHFRVVLWRYGIATVDVGDLVRLFDGMRLELRALVPAELAVGA